MFKNYPLKTLRGTEIEIYESQYNLTPGLQKVFTDTTYDAAKSMNDTEKVDFGNILQKTGYYNRKPIKGRLSGRDKYIKKDLDNDVKKF